MRTTLLISTILVAATSLSSASMASDVSVEARVSASSSAQSRTSDRTYDVKSRGDRNDSRSEVYDAALYKAAKKTRKKDYDWFRVIDSDVEKETRIRDDESSFEVGYERVPYRSCGLLTCRTEYRTESRTRTRIDFSDREETRFEVELEYEMGWGPIPNNGEVYDARQVIDSYR